MIEIKNDGSLEPFGLYLLRDSRLPLISPTRDIKEESDEYEGEVDFGTELSGYEGNLKCVTNEGLSKIEIVSKKNELVILLNLLRSGDYLTYESDSNKKIFVRLAGSVEIQERVSWFLVNIPIQWSPLWISKIEKEHIGSGTIENEGTFETGLIIKIKGIVTNPEVVIGSETLRYTGTLGTEDVLVIDTDNKTVTFNGINALANFEGVFPRLQPGETEVVVAASGETSFKWRDCWI